MCVYVGVSSVASGLTGEAVAGVSMNQAELRVREKEGGGGAASVDVAAEVAAFEAVVERYEGALLRYGARLIGRAGEEAEDVVQEALLRFLKQRVEQGADSVGDERVWLFRVVHNLAMDVGRKRTRRKKIDERLAQEAAAETKAVERAADRRSDEGVIGRIGESGTNSGGLEPSGEAEKRETVELAMAELKKLPEAQREVVVLHVMEGMTMREIGEVVGVSASNVCYRLRAALETLGGKLRDRGVM